MRALSLAVMLLPLAAHAQRAGVDVETLSPGAAIVDVSVSDHGLASIYFAPPHAHQAATLRVDVRVASDANGARTAAAWFRETTSGALPELAGIGEHGAGDPGLIAFVRENVFVVVRAIQDGADVRALAQSIDAAIQRAPARLSASAPVHVRTPARVGELVPVSLPQDVIGAYVVASGAGYARQTPRGWSIVRTREGAIRARIATVDRWLRVQISSSR